MVSETWDTWSLLRRECTCRLRSGADESLHLREADNTKERQHGHHKPRGDRTPRTQTTTLLRSLVPRGWHSRKRVMPSTQLNPQAFCGTALPTEQSGPKASDDLAAPNLPQGTVQFKLSFSFVKTPVPSLPLPVCIHTCPTPLSPISPPTPTLVCISDRHLVFQSPGQTPLQPS